LKSKSKNVIRILYLFAFIILIYFVIDRKSDIHLIVRGDDMGFSHAANIGCIKAYQEGILTAVEVMVPCDDFPEAVRLLIENPDLDVGIHLTLTSEWENIKWGPLSNAPSLTDENGYFFPMIWPEGVYGADRSLATAGWKLEDVEKELRAQIELILEYLPHCSHATPHMGFNMMAPEVNRLAFSLIQEYNIDANIRFLPMEQISLFEDAHTLPHMIYNAVQILENLEPGTYEFYEHPGMIIEGQQGAWHIGAENDAAYRDAVTKALIDPRLKEVIKRRGIKLIGYKDLKFWQ
jgi:predicted glycoside hydrolase/deacetylase ChbG (UPF0249 family)